MYFVAKKLLRISPAFNRLGEQSTLSNLVLENCIAERIHSTTTSARVAGILTGVGLVVSGPFAELFNVFIKDCRVSDVHSNLNQASPLSAGILCEYLRRPKIGNNSVSNCDRGILLTGTDAIFPNNLFQLAATEDDALALPPVFIDLTSIPPSTPAQTFTNTVAGRGGPVSINPSSTTIDLNRNYLLPAATNLNFGGGIQKWQSGDKITYNNGGGTNIGGLANGDYYLIVYVPGYSDKGVIKDNVVDNCSVAGYQDTTPVSTTSAWINNVAMNNGTPCIDATNYDIVWSPGPYPVDSGFVGGPYPAGTNKWINMSLKP